MIPLILWKHTPSHPSLSNLYCGLEKLGHHFFQLKYLCVTVYETLCVFVCSPEPNLLSGTAHSVNKRGVKRRDLDLEELKEILSPLLPFVRTEHILPTNSEVLSDTVSVFVCLLFMSLVYTA